MASRRLTPNPSSLRRLLLLSALLGSAVLSACGGGDDDAAPAPGSQVNVAGTVDQPATYTAPALKALAASAAASGASGVAVTQTVTYNARGVPQTRTYNGVNLWTLLNRSTLQLGTGKNPILRKIVVAKGLDGYRVVFSGGELSSDFGNRGNAVAYESVNGGVASPLAADEGPLRITAPGDVNGGRYLSLLTNLDVLSSPSTQAAVPGGGLSTEFKVSGLVKNAGTTYNLAQLQALTTTTVTVAGRTFYGINLSTFLTGTATGTPGGLTGIDAAVNNDGLSYYVVATGSDGYAAIISLGEIDARFGNQPVLIAFDEGTAGAGLGTAGFARLVVPGDSKQGRWVSNLISLEVFKAPR
jgi:hypothetical protein